MQTLWDLWQQIIQIIPMMLSDTRYLMIIGVVVLLVHSQYKRKHLMEKRMFGLVRGTAWRDTLEALAYGLIGGLIGTFFFILLGISLTETGIVYLWFTALFLMLIHPRFLCFSYAGGIISLSFLIFGFPQVDIPAIMSLVAILHLVEAVLIFIHGDQKPTPVYVKHSTGKVVGGFTMQKFWPLPFVALVAFAMAESAVDFQSIPMPDWWPLIRPDVVVPDGQTLIYVMFPVMAALGYSDLAITSSPRVKARQSAFHLLIFSGILLFLAILADRNSFLLMLPALFSPLGHEVVIHLGQQREKTNSPVYTTKDGVMVLDVYPNSPAAKMGLEPGDVILAVNDIPIETPLQLSQEMSPWLIDPVFTVANTVRGEGKRTVAFRGKIPPVGIIPVPDPHTGMYMQMREGTLKSWLRRLWNKRKG